MQIVIELSDETYKDIKEENGIYGINNGLNARITGKVVGAIQSGTPLSKGHGRLIDADAYIDKHEECGWLDDIAVNEFNTITPTIIEADKTRDCNSCAHSDQGRCAGTEVCHECMWSNKFVEADTGSKDKG